MKKRILSLVLCLALCMGMVSSLTGCGGSGNVDAFVIITMKHLIMFPLHLWTRIFLPHITFI